MRYVSRVLEAHKNKIAVPEPPRAHGQRSAQEDRKIYLVDLDQELQQGILARVLLHEPFFLWFCKKKAKDLLNYLRKSAKKNPIVNAQVQGGKKFPYPIQGIES